MASQDTSKNEETFVIRRAKSLDDLQWVIKMATEEGFTPRKKEAECYFLAGLTPYFYIGELNGKRIGCISLVEHKESVAIGSYYIIAKPYRGLGFGKKMYDFSSPSSDKCNVLTFSLLYLKDYHQKQGFQPGWIVKNYELTASRAIEGLASSQLPPSVEKISPANQVDFEKLFAYGADMLGTSQTCKSLLTAWLCHLQESSWAAIDSAGEVVGYLLMSETVRFPEQGYYISPFYANSAPIARSLLKVAAAFAAARNPRHILYLDTPLGHIPEAISMLENELGARNISDLIFMGKKGIPDKCLSKVFSVASCQVV